MSRGELNRLLEDARRQPLLLAELRERLADPQATRRWTADHGYELGAEEVAELQNSDRELSDDELDRAAGGDWAPTPPPPPGTGG
jgi:predicted ribosomally synthesized peptide with nif11-like leader